MPEINHVVAFELGSSKIAGIVGSKAPDGSIKILAYAHKNSNEFIRKGTISNVDKTVAAIKDIKQQLEDTIQMRIDQAFVGICGLSIRSERNTVMRQFGMEEKHINDEIINEIINENSTHFHGDEEILNVVIQEYQTATTTTLDPIGALTRSINGNFLNIIARSTLRIYIQRCFEQAGMQIECIVAPEATASIALNAVEQRSGCALVDIGAETTTISIYKNSILRHLRLLPIGSASITRDLCKLPSIAPEEEEAESVKQKYGVAIYTPRPATLGGESMEEEYAALSNGRSVSLEQICQYTAARAEEIIANAWQQVKNSGYESELMGGIILTGGGSNLKRIDELMQLYSKKTCHIASGNRSNLKITGYPINQKEGIHLTLIGLLNLGDANCCSPLSKDNENNDPTETPVDAKPATETIETGKFRAGTTIKPTEEKKEEPEEPKPKKPSWKSRIMSMLSNIVESED